MIHFLGINKVLPLFRLIRPRKGTEQEKGIYYQCVQNNRIINCYNKCVKKNSRIHVIIGEGDVRMSLIFVTENGATIGIEDNRCYVRLSDNSVRSYPLENIEGISIFGKSQVTTNCIEECLKRGIAVSYLSQGGQYYGMLQSPGHVNTHRQRRQCELYESKFAVELAKKILVAKINNQFVVLNRYNRTANANIESEIKMMKICRCKIKVMDTIDEIMGYEGMAAKEYFKGVSKVINPEFKFDGRSRRPAKDEFNSMINFGYYLLNNEIYSKVEAKGFNPYFGFIHRDKEKHPTLVSDLIEEWRAVIVDATVLSLINGHEVSKEDFYEGVDKPGCFIGRNNIKIFIVKLENKLKTCTKYLDYIDYSVSFRRAIELQLDSLSKAMEEDDVELYRPMVIR